MSAVTAKYGAIVGPVAGVAISAHFDTLAKVAAVSGGILLGMLWRAGSLRGEGRTWADVRSDLTVSALIGGANAVLALAIVQAFEGSVMFAMAAGVLIGATGLRALPEIKEALMNAARRKLLGDNVALIQPPDPEIDDLLRQIDRDV